MKSAVHGAVKTTQS